MASIHLENGILIFMKGKMSGKNNLQHIVTAWLINDI